MGAAMAPVIGSQGKWGMSKGQPSGHDMDGKHLLPIALIANNDAQSYSRIKQERRKWKGMNKFYEE